MFCIAAFIVLTIISIFSAKYRVMVGRAWGCVGRKLTLRPCDTKFKDEMKSRLLARVALKRPRMLKAASIGLEIAAFIIVILTVWSLYVVVKSGLNLYVYGTCAPANASSCSIGAEACSIDTVKPSFVTSVKELKLHSWIANEADSFADTVSAIPTRLQSWKAENYLPENASYKQEFSDSKPLALEVIDPGCKFCRELYEEQVEANFSDRYNLSYIAYPIKDEREPGGYKFKNSLLVVRYLEATKIEKLNNEDVPADWQILNRIFTGKDKNNTDYQLKFNMMFSATQAEDELRSWLKDFGYSEEQINKIEELANSDKVKNIIDTNRKIVDDKIKTVKIPTMIFDGRRHHGVLDADKLQ